MRKVHIDKVYPGATLAKAIFTAEGRILLTAGMKIKRSYIEKLRLNGISEVYIIDDETPKKVQIDDAICEETRREAQALVKKSINNYIFSEAINTEKVNELVVGIIDELLSSKEILVNMYDIKNVDDYTFAHSINVCVLSLITGVGLGYNILRLKDLGAGALLHDIGKLRVPKEILKKPSKLTPEEFEEIKKHTVYGYEILKDNKNVSMISAFIAFGHHERYDGSGYPLGLRGENIHQCARIVATADVFDALSSDRVYRKKLRPHEVVEYITSLGSHHFDPEIVKSFVKYIAIYPVGTGVRLNTGERGVVIKANKATPTRPVVQVVYDKSGERIKDPHVIDLLKERNVCIVESCELESEVY